MSRAAWINELTDLGYEPGVLDGLNNNELACLVQEEFIENKWTDAARAAAAAGKHHHVFMKGGSIGSKNDSGKHGSYVSSHATAEEAQAKVKRMNKLLSPGEKKYYGMKYHYKTSTQLG